MAIIRHSPPAGSSRRRVVSDSEEEEETGGHASKRRKTPQRGSSSPAPQIRTRLYEPFESADDLNRDRSDGDLDEFNSDSWEEEPVPRSQYVNDQEDENGDYDDKRVSQYDGGSPAHNVTLDVLAAVSSYDALAVKTEHYENGHAEEDLMDDEDPDQARATPGRIEFRPEYERDRDGFVAGSIVRIKCKGFMTYDFVEFYPGPHLNIILGPNGTGKSSIAAAIAIGLGFAPKVMGRANDLRSYVKQGTEQAETEIELKNRKGKANLVIKRRFNREDDKSEWFLGNQPVTKKTIVDIVAGFGVQADNLCSFLAQDKVADFAKMAPVKVLEETIKAAGDPRLSKWHETLIEKGNKAREIEATLTDHIATRDTLQNRVNEMAPEVEHFHQRKEQEMQREILECLVPISDVNEYSRQLIERKEEKKRLLQKTQQAGLRQQPINALKEREMNLQRRAEKQSDKATADLDKLTKNFSNCKRRIDDASREAQEADRELKGLKRKADQLESQKEDCQRKINDAKAILEVPREQVDAEIAERTKIKRDINESVRRSESEYTGLQQANREEEDRLTEVRKRIDACGQKLQGLNNLEKVKEDIARDSNGSINYLLDWMERNPDKLEGTVHKPPMISVNVRDKDLAWQIEACTNLSQRSTFICERKKDYDTLVGLLNGQYPPRRDSKGGQQPGGRIRFNIQLVDVTEATVNPPRPCSTKELARLGFAGFAVDLIEAAPAVIAFLNGAAKLHMAAVSRLPGDRINSDEMVKLGLPCYVTATDINRINRSNYGRKEAQITQMPPVKARAFHHTVDRLAVQAIADEKGRLQIQLQEAEGPSMQRKQNLQAVLEKTKQLKRDLDEADMKLKESKEKVQKYHRAQAVYDGAMKTLADLQRRPGYEADIARHRATKLEAVKKMLRPIREYSATSKESLDGIDYLVTSSFRTLQHQMNCAAIEDKISSGAEEEREAMQELDLLKSEIDRIRVKFNTAKDKSSAILKSKHRDVIAQVKLRANSVGSPQEARQQLDAVIADLEMSAGVDANFIARHGRLERDLAGVVAIVTEKEKDLKTLKTQIDKILDSFDPALNALVEVVSRKFSAAFEKVGCSGEVRVDRKELDFAQWGIQILVSYRDSEALQVLTATRQSGGERALATVTYIMSLSEMARTPFSLVDEINQGMDQRSERNVHNQLVGVTCAPDAGQYFLITPKLLTNLDYNKRMKILIVNNGPWLPDGTNKKAQWGNLSACLKRYKQSIKAH